MLLDLGARRGIVAGGDHDVQVAVGHVAEHESSGSRPRTRARDSPTSCAYAFMFSMGRLTSKVSSGAMFCTCQTSSRMAQMARRSFSEFAMATSLTMPVFQRFAEHGLEPRAIVSRDRRPASPRSRRTARRARSGAALAAAGAVL